MDVSSVSEEKISEVEVKSTHSAPIAAVTPVTTFAGGLEQEHRLEVPTTTFGGLSEPVQIRSSFLRHDPGVVSSRPSSAPDQSGGSRRSRSSGRTSAIMVEEEPASWLRDYGGSDRFRRGFV